jgi:hypothetical protein
MLSSLVDTNSTRWSCRGSQTTKEAQLYPHLPDSNWEISQEAVQTLLHWNVPLLP